MREPDSVLLLTRSEPVIDVVLAAAAALGVAVRVLGNADESSPAWPGAGAVFVADDLAPALAARGPKPRAGVYLVGFAAEALVPWSVPLGGQVIVLPGGIAALSAVLSDDRGTGAPMVCVVAGCGGAGASTLAAGLAVAARRRGLASALVDLDPIGGGVDLLLGAERTPGWRWPKLLGAHGEVNDVRRFLPQVDGVTVVSMGRALGSDAEVDEGPSAESVRAVLGSLARHHDVVLLDPGRTPLASARQSLGACRTSLLVTGTGVREVAATAAIVRGLELNEPRLVIRRSPGSAVSSDVVGRALGIAVAATLPDDRTLPRAAEHGDPPGRRGRGKWARAVARLLDEVLADGREPKNARGARRAC